MTNLDLSLDDLIASSRKTGGGKGKGRGKSKGKGAVLRQGGGDIWKKSSGWGGGNSWGGKSKGKGKSRSYDWDDDWEPRRKGKGKGKGKGWGSGYGIRVEGLDFGVSAEDLLELFTTVGGCEKAWVDYDSTDRSEGTGGASFSD